MTSSRSSGAPVFRPRVASRAFELALDVVQGEAAEAFVGIEEAIESDFADPRWIAHQLGDAGTQVSGHRFDHGVALGVYRGAVERILAVHGSSRKPAGELEGLGAEAGDVEQASPAGEWAAGIAVLDDRGRQALGQSGDASQERR